nr:MAG TPA: hypothetical protein [Caudoviricetes sp.]
MESFSPGNYSGVFGMQKNKKRIRNIMNKT